MKHPPPIRKNKNADALTGAGHIFPLRRNVKIY